MKSPQLLSDVCLLIRVVVPRIAARPALSADSIGLPVPAILPVLPSGAAILPLRLVFRVRIVRVCVIVRVRIVPIGIPAGLSGAPLSVILPGRSLPGAAPIVVLSVAARLSAMIAVAIAVVVAVAIAVAVIRLLPPLRVLALLSRTLLPVKPLVVVVSDRVARRVVLTQNVCAENRHRRVVEERRDKETAHRQCRDEDQPKDHLEKDPDPAHKSALLGHRIAVRVRSP